MTAEEIVAQLPVPIDECAIVSVFVGGPYEVRVEHIEDAYNAVYRRRFSSPAEAEHLVDQLREVRALAKALLK